MVKFVMQLRNKQFRWKGKWFMAFGQTGNSYSSLQGNAVRINRGGPDSVEGTLVGTGVDYLVIQAKDGVVYIKTSHIKSFSENLGTKGRTTGTMGRTGRSIIRAYNFDGVLRALKHQRVQINRGGPEKIDGIISDYSNDSLTLVVNKELVHVQTYHVKSVTVRSRSSNSSNQNSSKNSSRSSNKNGSKSSNSKTGGKTGGRTGGRTSGRTSGGANVSATADSRTSGRTGGSGTRGRTGGAGTGGRNRTQGDHSHDGDHTHGRNRTQGSRTGGAGTGGRNRTQGRRTGGSATGGRNRTQGRTGGWTTWGRTADGATGGYSWASKKTGSTTKRTAKKRKGSSSRVSSSKKWDPFA